MSSRQAEKATTTSDDRHTLTAASTHHQHQAEPLTAPGGINAILLAVLTVFVAVLLVLIGATLLWANVTQREDGKYLATSSEQRATSSYALTYERLELRPQPGWIVDRFEALRVRATGPEGSSLFVGIAPEADVDAYLGTVAHEEIVARKVGPGFVAETRDRPGNPPQGPPSDQEFWSASADGTAAATVTWEVLEGEWAIVVMNADASRSVAANIEFGVEADWIVPTAIAPIVAALMIILGGACLILLATRVGD